MLSAPSAFKPTLTSEYFFLNEPQSPPVDLHPVSSPELESPTGAVQPSPPPVLQELLEEVTFKQQQPEQQAHVSAAEDVRMEDSALPPPAPVLEPVAEKPLITTADVLAMQQVPGLGSPTLQIGHLPVQAGAFQPSSHSQANSSSFVAPVPSPNHMRVHEVLAAAALDSSALPPELPPSGHRYSTSTASGASYSTAPSSSVNSPHTPHSDGLNSISVSATHTPSPPPLTLPNPAAAAHLSQRAGEVTFAPSFQTQPAGVTQAVPQTAPASYRSVQAQQVPAAASQLQPVQLPPHQQPTTPVRAPYHTANSQHAQTPHQPSRKRLDDDQHPSTHSNPSTPPAQSKQLAALSLLDPTPAENVEYVGPFILGPVLGRGCTGTVRLGTHRKTKFQVAFKIIEKRYLASDPKLWKKVKREIVILKLIEHCLSSSTIVLYADGTSRPASEVAAGDILLGEGGTGAIVDAVQKDLPAAVLWRITMGDGSMDVTAEHQLTLSCRRNPCVALLPLTAQELAYASTGANTHWLQLTWWEVVTTSAGTRELAMQTHQFKVQLVDDSSSPPPDTTVEEVDLQQEMAHAADVEEDARLRSQAASPSAAPSPPSAAHAIDMAEVLAAVKLLEEEVGMPPRGDNLSDEFFFTRSLKEECLPGQRGILHKASDRMQYVMDTQASEEAYMQDEGETVPAGRGMPAGGVKSTRLQPSKEFAQRVCALFVARNAPLSATDEASPAQNVSYTDASLRSPPGMLYTIVHTIRGQSTKNLTVPWEHDKRHGAESGSGTRAALQLLGRAKLVEMAARLRAQNRQMLVLGTIFELPVKEFVKAVDHYSDLFSHFAAVRVPRPVRAPAAMSDASSLGESLVPAVRPMIDAALGCSLGPVHQQCVLVARGGDEYVPLERAQGVRLKVGYQLLNPVQLQFAIHLGQRGASASTFLNLESLHRDLLGIALTEETGLLITELNPIATDEMESTLPEYDAVCRASMVSVLCSGVTTWLAFGRFTRRRWLIDGPQLTSAEHGMAVVSTKVEQHQCITRLHLSFMLNGEKRECMVYFAPHPCQQWRLPEIAVAMAMVHGLPDKTVSRLAQEAASWLITPFTAKPVPLDGLHPIVNIVIRADREEAKRYAVMLENGAVLTHNSHVLKLYDVLETESRLYLVLEHVTGGELFDYIVSKGRLDRHEALRIIAQIVMGLEHCHAHNVAHRDLKPENLLLTSSGRVVIADFGMASLFLPSVTSTSSGGVLKTSCGSPHYASPEIIEGSSYDAKSTDMWSIGVILFALITGSLPFDHDNIPTLLTMVTKGHYTTPAYVPADVAHLISRMLTVDPKKRITIPEIKRHICFRGGDYFHTNDHNALSVESLTNKLSSHSSSHKRLKASSATSSTTGGKDEQPPIRPVPSFDNDEIHEHSRRKGHKLCSAAAMVDAKEHSASSDTRAAPSSSTTAPHRHAALDEDTIDEAVLADLESLGLGSRDGNREELRRKIRDVNKEPSLEQVFYKLLRQRKLDRLQKLAMLSPKVKPMQERMPRELRSSSRRNSMLRAADSCSQPASSMSAVSTPDSHMVISSTPGSAVAKASEAGMQPPELVLPQPEAVTPVAVRPRTSPVQPDAPMVDAAAVPAAAAGTAERWLGSGSSIYQPTAPSAAVQPSVAPLHSSIFGGASTYAAALFEAAMPKPPLTIDPSSNSPPALQMSPGMGINPVITSPSQSTIAVGMPAALGAAVAASGVQSLAHLPTAMPPMQHCYSDGAVPESIMQTDSDHSATGFYLAMSKVVPPPPLQISNSAPRPGDVEEMPASPNSSATPRRLVTPDLLTGSLQLGSAYQRDDSPAQASSLSAQVSPAAGSHRIPLFNRRMSTPAAAHSGESGYYQPPRAARTLFPDDDTDMVGQSSLDTFGKSAAAAGPSAQSMEVDEEAGQGGMSASAPLNSMQHTLSPPVLQLPRVAAPHIKLPASSGSETEDADEVKQDRESRVAPPTNRPMRAYSQDETTLDSEHHRHHGPPTDRIASNVRTPMQTPSTEGAGFPSYSTSPRFHRVTFHGGDSDRQGAASSNATAPRHKSLTMRSSTHNQPPPSPQHKKSWFSSVFGSTNFSLFDRLKGKRSSAESAKPAADSASSSPSPLLSPAARSGSSNGTGFVTKRATLTLSNELTRLFAGAGVQFVHSGGYKFGCSWHPSAPPEFNAPPMPMPMPMQMPLMQRAVSTPDETASFRPRSKSIAESPKSPYDERASTNVQRAPPLPAFVPSTPKPTPTRSLGQPFVPSSLSYPASPPVEPAANRPLLDRAGSNSSNSACSRESSDNNLSGSAMQSPSLGFSQMSSPATSTAASSAAGTPFMSPTSQQQQQQQMRPKNPANAQFAALFGTAPCRFQVELRELTGDQRMVTLTRKSGDKTTFERIQSFVQKELHL